LKLRRLLITKWQTSLHGKSMDFITMCGLKVFGRC
jgi:hypothetical protein